MLTFYDLQYTTVGVPALTYDAEQVDFRISDISAKKIVEKISHCKTIVEYQKLNIEKRNKYIKKLKENGLSIRQISKLAGVSFGVVRKKQ